MHLAHPHALDRSRLLEQASSGPRLAQFIQNLDHDGILSQVLPEIAALKPLEHHPGHHPEGGVWIHVMLCLEKSQTCDPVSNVAILMHDIGKAVTRSYDETGRVRYRGHEVAGLAVFERIQRRLVFSAEEEAAIRFSIQAHMHGHHLDSMKEMDILALRTDPHWPSLYYCIQADEASRAHLWSPGQFAIKMRRVERIYDDWVELVS